MRRERMGSGGSMCFATCGGTRFHRDDQEEEIM
jgi:hypothetical protein